uniref:Uncharacterized protein n=1 Tax=Ditylenchus dipsaci TaxID=166011 RepID=A0A915EQ47_9BILA
MVRSAARGFQQMNVSFVQLSKNMKSFTYTVALEQVPTKEYVKILASGFYIKIVHRETDEVLHKQLILDEDEILVHQGFDIEFEDVGDPGSPKMKIVIRGGVIVASDAVCTAYQQEGDFELH